MRQALPWDEPSLERGLRVAQRRVHHTLEQVLTTSGPGGMPAADPGMSQGHTQPLNRFVTPLSEFESAWTMADRQFLCPTSSSLIADAVTLARIRANTFSRPYLTQGCWVTGARSHAAVLEPVAHLPGIRVLFRVIFVHCPGGMVP